MSPASARPAFVTDFVKEIREARLLGILRGCPRSGLEAVAEAAVASGLGFLEVAMNTDGAADQIRFLQDRLAGNCQVGAGTVLTARQAREAVEAEATFLVSPCLVPEVQDWADDHGIPTLPGALTPSEIWKAHRAGAAVVKVFPARSAGGPSYFRELRGPFRDVPLLACGGVSTENAREYMEAGADVLAFGGSVFTAKRLGEMDVSGMRDAILSLHGAAKAGS